MLRLATCAFLLVASALAGAAADPSGPQAIEPIGRWMRPSEAPISAEARIFLVAGSRDIANFAQEVVDQKKYWLQRGFGPQHIECFYAVPDPSHPVDVEQFLALEKDLADCHLASPRAVLTAINQLANSYTHDWFYLYVTSHGTYPPLQWPPEIQRQLDPTGAWLPRVFGEARADASSRAFAWMGSYRIEMEAIDRDIGGGWGWMPFLQRYLTLEGNDVAWVQDHLLTPRLLSDSLLRLPESTHKVVVLQGCHSGGFLLPPDQAPKPEDTLVRVPNITVLTAARADRTSFGCAGGDRTTYYGGSLQQVLDGLPAKDPGAQDWQRVHAEVSRAVERMEKEQDIPEDRLSLPQYFSNRQ